MSNTKKVRVPRVEKTGKAGQPAFDFNESVLDDIEDLGQRLSIESICDYLGISVTTWHNAIEKNPEILLRYKKGKSVIDNKVAKTFIEQAQSGECATRQIFYLKTRMGWSEKSIVDNVSSDGSMTPPKTIKVEYE